MVCTCGDAHMVCCVLSTVSLWDGKDGACLKFVNVSRSRKHSGIKVCVCV